MQLECMQGLRIDEDDFDLGARLDEEPILDYIDYLIATETIEEMINGIRETDDLLMDIDLSDFIESAPATPKQIVLNPFLDWQNIDAVLKADELSIDTETTGLDPRFRIRLLQVYLPHLDQIAVLDLWNLTTEQTRWLSALLQAIQDPKIKKYFQNALFDLYWYLYKFRILGRNIVDTMLLSLIRKAGQIEGYRYEAKITTPNSLGYLSLEHGLEHDKENQGSDWKKIPLDEDQLAYAGRDPIATYHIGKKLLIELTKEQPEVIEAELSSIPYFVYCQYFGLPADPSDIFQAYAKYNTKAQELKAQLINLMPYDPCHHEKVLADRANPRISEKTGKPLKGLSDKPFNPASPSQLAAYLVSKGWEEYTKQESKTTGEEMDGSGKPILFHILNDHPEETQLKTLIEYKEISKAASTIASYLDCYCPMRKSIRTSYRVLAPQGMGRSKSGGDRVKKDSQNPGIEPLKACNSQNWSKFLPSHARNGLPPIRSIVSARPGWSLCEVDLSASHAQFARYLSKDRSLQESYDSGLKLHYYTLAKILAFEGMNVTPHECLDLVSGKADSARQTYYENLYKLAKTVFYSYLNCAGGATLQNSFFKQEVYVSLQACCTYLEACSIAFERLSDYQQQCFKLAKSRIEQLFAVTGESIGWFGWSKTCDGALVYHRAKWQNRGGKSKLDLKISDVVSVQWMRPEGTVMKKSLGEVCDLAVDVWGIGKTIELVTFTHDSLLVMIRNEEIPVILPEIFNITERNMQKYIPDYKHEDRWEDCIKGERWEKMKKKK